MAAVILVKYKINLKTYIEDARYLLQTQIPLNTDACKYAY